MNVRGGVKFLDLCAQLATPAYTSPGVVGDPLALPGKIRVSGDIGAFGICPRAKAGPHLTNLLSILPLSGYAH